MEWACEVGTRLIAYAMKYRKKMGKLQDLYGRQEQQYIYGVWLWELF
jgi:hypothetical protein